ncbi:MAG: Hsp20/alpha crystallin family protein [Anaerolineae bacterium]
MRRDDERDPEHEPTGTQNQPDWSMNSGPTVYVWRRTRRFVPPTDVIELPDRLVVRVEIAGLAPDAFSITLLNRRLIINGKRERPHWDVPTPPGAAYHRVEIGYGEFRVEVALPFVVRGDAVSADYENGMLQVELPRLRDGQIHIVDVGNATDKDGNQSAPEDAVDQPQ